MNKRKAFRKDINIPGTMLIGDKRYMIIILNISLYGAYFNILDSDISIHINDKVTLLYTLPNKKLTEVTEVVKVIRIVNLPPLTYVGSEVILLNLYSSQQKNKGFFTRE